jgi:hypothetical protein
VKCAWCATPPATKVFVITGLVPVIHALTNFQRGKDVDDRVKPGHDEWLFSGIVQMHQVR